LFVLTFSGICISSDVVGSKAWRGEVAGGCTGPVEPTCRQRCRTTIGHVSVHVCPRESNAGQIIRRTRQRITLLELRSNRRRDVHKRRTCCRQRRVPITNNRYIYYDDANHRRNLPVPVPPLFGLRGTVPPTFQDEKVMNLLSHASAEAICGD